MFAAIYDVYNPNNLGPLGNALTVPRVMSIIFWCWVGVCVLVGIGALFSRKLTLRDCTIF